MQPVVVKRQKLSKWRLRALL